MRKAVSSMPDADKRSAAQQKARLSWALGTSDVTQHNTGGVLSSHTDAQDNLSARALRRAHTQHITPGWHGKAFLVESLVLLAILVASLAVLMGLFVNARVESTQGERLTQAVQLAQNAAEEFAADPLAAHGQTFEFDGLEATVQVESEAPLSTSAASAASTASAGVLLHATVVVRDAGGSGAYAAGEEVYRLETATYVPGMTESEAEEAGVFATDTPGEPGESAESGVDASEPSAAESEVV